MIKDQTGYLENMDYCKNENAISFIEEFNILPQPDNNKSVLNSPEISVFYSGKTIYYSKNIRTQKETGYQPAFI